MAQVVNDGVVDHAVLGQRLPDRRDLKYADAQVSSAPDRPELLMLMPLSLRYASTNVERYSGESTSRTFGVRRHVHPQIAIALAQGGAHEAALDRGTPVILHAGSQSALPITCAILFSNPSPF